MAEETKSKSYEVGYGKPPVRTRFQKGQSGNPKGFPRGEQKLKFVLMRSLAMPVEELAPFEPHTGTEMMAIHLMMTAIRGRHCRRHNSLPTALMAR